MDAIIANKVSTLILFCIRNLIVCIHDKYAEQYSPLCLFGMCENSLPLLCIALYPGHFATQSKLHADTRHLHRACKCNCPVFLQQSCMPWIAWIFAPHLQVFSYQSQSGPFTPFLFKLKNGLLNLWTPPYI